MESKSGSSLGWTVQFSVILDTSSFSLVCEYNIRPNSDIGVYIVDMSSLLLIKEYNICLPSIMSSLIYADDIWPDIWIHGLICGCMA